MFSRSVIQKGRARFDRQFRVLIRNNPRIARALRWISSRRGWPVRIPLALLLVIGGVFSILPFLGLWMLPAGLFLLAIDIPPLQRPMGRLILRMRVFLRRKSRKTNK